MPYSYVRLILVVVLGGIAGAVLWYYTYQEQVNAGRVSLGAIFALVTAVALGIKLGLFLIYVTGGRL